MLISTPRACSARSPLAAISFHTSPRPGLEALEALEGVEGLEGVEVVEVVSKENRESTGRRGGGREVETRVGCLVFLDLILSQRTQTCRTLLGPTGVMA